MRSEREDEPPRRSRAARAAIWTGKAALRVTWGAVKLAGKGAWWAGKAGVRAARGRARRNAQEEPPPRR